MKIDAGSGSLLGGGIRALSLSMELQLTSGAGRRPAAPATRKDADDHALQRDHKRPTRDRHTASQSPRFMG